MSFTLDKEEVALVTQMVLPSTVEAIIKASSLLQGGASEFPRQCGSVIQLGTCESQPVGTGETVQQPRTLTALVKDLGSSPVPTRLTDAGNSSSRVSNRIF